MAEYVVFYESDVYHVLDEGGVAFENYLRNSRLSRDAAINQLHKYGGLTLCGKEAWYKIDSYYGGRPAPRKYFEIPQGKRLCQSCGRVLSDSSA